MKFGDRGGDGGRIWGIDVEEPAGEAVLRLDTDLTIGSFGEGENGELYGADMTGGALYRLAAVTD